MRGIIHLVPKTLISLLKDDIITAHKLCINVKYFLELKINYIFVINKNYKNGI